MRIGTGRFLNSTLIRHLLAFATRCRIQEPPPSTTAVGEKSSAAKATIQRAMYIRKEDAKELTRQFTEGLTGSFEGKTDFLLGLLKQDDWSFVIKAHALIEEAVTEVIVAHLGQESLKGLIERLPLSDAKAGKLVATKQLGLLPDNHRKFIRWFSELRNILAHRLENTSFTFEAHLAAFDANQRRSWKQNILCWSDREADRPGLETLAEEHPKVLLVCALTVVIGECILLAEHAKSRRRLDDAEKLAMKEIFGPNGISLGED